MEENTSIVTARIAPRYNCRFNADANTGHAFGIFMASVGTLRPGGLRRRLTWALGLTKYRIKHTPHEIHFRTVINKIQAAVERRNFNRSDEPEGLVLRVIAGLIAIPLFEFALFLACYLAVGRRTAASIFLALPMWLHAAYSSVALFIGLFFGFAGLTWLLGHLFMTHFPNDRNHRITAVIWLCIGALMLVGYNIVAAR